MKEILYILPAKDKEALGTVRTIVGIRIAATGEELWLRGVDANQKPDLRIRQLPALRTFVLEEDQLFPLGGLTPVDKLPDLEWIPLSDFMRPELPTSAMPGKVTGKYNSKLVPSARVEEGIALLIDLATWKTYAGTAPEIRLEKLRFAVSEHNQAMIMGNPLPPVPGREYWGRDGILLPAGYDFELPLVAGLLAGKLNAGRDSVLFFNADGSWEKIPSDDFVAATRSAVRLTEGEKTDD